MAAQRPFEVEKEGLEQELKRLRTRDGFIPSRILEARSLLAVLGGEQQGFDSLFARFHAALDSLPDQENVDLLRASYGLLPDFAGLTLRERRDRYREVSEISYDTQETREDAVITELVITLLTAFYAGAPVAAELPMPHGGILMEGLAVKTLIRDRRFMKHMQARKIISLVDGAKGFAYHSYEETEVEPMDGMSVKTEYVNGGSLHTCYFPTPLKRGDTHRFAFREMLCREQEDKPTENEDYAGQCFVTPTLSYWQQVRFEGERPAMVWWYDKLSPIERPGVPDEKHTLPVGEDCVVEREFTQLYGGLYSGIAWRWEK